MPCLSHPQVVRRALSIVEEHPVADTISIRELSDAAHVSERTLRNAFHDVYGVAPKQFLIRHGLEEARRALLATRGERGSVTRVATECGFFELGRFAGAYRRMFGERPSETLYAVGSQA